MLKNSTKTVEEKILLKNALKTAMYLMNDLLDEDFDSAKLELEELRFVMGLLKDTKIKRERMQILLNLVLDMKKRGLNLDFASAAKNAVETNKNILQNTQKRQQA